jgi:YD repeat-containing protein
MKKTIILSLLSLLSFYEIYSQVEGFKTFPVAPSGYEFLKYGEFPVSKYSGVPNITVPIYTIDTGTDDLKIPITLTYHSTGFSVNEEAGWTGLGWTLNEGGTIVQVVNGYDDFKTGYDINRELFDIDKVIHHASHGSAPENYWTASKCYQGQTFVNMWNKYFILPTKWMAGEEGPDQRIYVPNTFKLFGLEGHYDFEPDVFNFNFIGYSGKFVLDWETETFKCLTDPKIKVDKKPNSHNQITITTPDGHIFEFSVKDESISLDGYTGVTSRIYKLDNIYTKKGQQINYTYVKTNVVNNFPAIIKSEVKDPTLLENIRSSSHELNTKQTFSYVDKIRFNNGMGEIEFTMSDRQDFVGTKKLDSIKIKVIKPNTAKTIKQFTFNYSYFVGHSNGTVVAYKNYLSKQINKNSEEYTHRLKLDSLVESGKPAYIFQYNQTSFPKKNSRARDYWGYYNGFLTNSTSFPNIHRFNYQFLSKNEGYTSYSHFEGVENLDIYKGNNRSSRLAYTKAGVLEKIIFPTGGFTTFDYELNSFTNCIVPSFEDTENTQYESNRISYGAGLRIREIKNFDTNRILLSKKTYTYKGGNLSNPLLFYNKTFIDYFIDFTKSGQLPSSGWRSSVKASNFNTPSLSSSGNIGYKEVIEHFNSNDTLSKNNGKIKYIFQNKKPKMSIDPSKGLITESAWRSHGKYAELSLPLYLYSIKNGSLLEQQIFDKNEVLIQKIENKYSYAVNDYCTYGTRKGRKMSNIVIKNNLGGSVVHQIGGYTIGGVHTNLKESKTTNYFNDNDSLVTKNEYLYDKYWQVKEKKFTNSKNETLTTKIYYPEDVISYYNLGLPHLNSLEKKAIDSLKATAKHRINTPIQTETYKNDILTSKQRNVFKAWTWGNIIELQKVQSSKGTAPLEDRFIYHKYDNKGNPIEVSKPGGLHSVLIWGYNQTKLITKIENCTYDQLMRYSYNSGTGVLSSIYSAANNDDGTVGKKNILRAKLQKLRDDFPNAQVTTYTYDPLIGVTSITDPKGYTIYYEYDEFNRLKQVKDADGNILSNNQYNYKN